MRYFTNNSTRWFSVVFAKTFHYRSSFFLYINFFSQQFWMIFMSVIFPTVVESIPSKIYKSFRKIKLVNITKLGSVQIVTYRIRCMFVNCK